MDLVEIVYMIYWIILHIKLLQVNLFAIWVKSTEIVTLEYNDGYVYNSWKDADSGTTKPDFTRIVHLTLSNGKELNVLNTEEFDLELQSDEQ